LITLSPASVRLQNAHIFDLRQRCFVLVRTIADGVCVVITASRRLTTRLAEVLTSG
jgi:hypothetical protein